MSSCINYVIIIFRSHRQQRSVALTLCEHDWQPCAIPFWCRMESRLQCGGATSDMDDRVVYASVSLDGCSLSHRWLAAGLDVPGRYSPSLTTSPNNCSRLLSIISCIWGSPEVFRTSSLRTKWNHWSSSIWRWEWVCKASRRRRSSHGNVQHSEPYRRMDRMQTRYRRNLVSLESSLWCLQTLCIEFMAEEAMPIRLRTSSAHLPMEDCWDPR